MAVSDRVVDAQVVVGILDRQGFRIFGKDRASDALVADPPRTPPNCNMRSQLHSNTSHQSGLCLRQAAKISLGQQNGAFPGGLSGLMGESGL